MWTLGEKTDTFPFIVYIYPHEFEKSRFEKGDLISGRILKVSIKGGNYQSSWHNWSDLYMEGWFV